MLEQFPCEYEGDVRVGAAATLVDEITKLDLINLNLKQSWITHLFNSIDIITIATIYMQAN